MHSADIIANLKKKGHTGVSIAHDLNVDPSAVSKTINDKCSSKRIANYISGILKKDKSNIWPKRYLPEGGHK